MKKAMSVEKSVNDGEELLSLLWRELFDFLEAPPEMLVGALCRSEFGSLEAEQLVDGLPENLRESG